MYAQDSFFTLTLAGRAGVLCVSLALMSGVIGLGLALMRGRSRGLRLGIAALVFLAFVWLSPQIYYQYYRLIFDGLPQQAVVKPLPDIAFSARLLTFSDTASLSYHAQGVLGWILIFLAFRGKRRRLSP